MNGSQRLTTSKRLHTKRASYEGRIQLVSLAGGTAAVIVALTLLWIEDYSAQLQITLTLVIVAVWLGSAISLRSLVVFPLRTLSNLLEAIRDGDYTLRASGARTGDAMGEVMHEVNMLSESLQRSRSGQLEASVLLQKILAEVDIAILAFDEDKRICFSNTKGEQLLGEQHGQLLGRTDGDLCISELLTGKTPRIMDLNLPGGIGRWELRRTTFREGGIPRQLVMLSDLTRTLHEEEKQAWERLIQILRHEINNSLAPVHSLAISLADMVDKEPRPSSWESDLREGLDTIANRSEALNRIMVAYAKLTKLPEPQYEAVDVAEWVGRVVKLETRMVITILPGPDIKVEADGGQLDQLLINLIKNAVDAALIASGGVTIRWQIVGASLEMCVEDEGPGLANIDNLFVPFYTTKPEGAGIGLILSRQIAETHGGALAIVNRTDGSGCRASVRLPLM